MNLLKLHRAIFRWPKTNPKPAADLYDSLDARYGIAQHGIDRGFFHLNPDHNALWIPMYFENRALLQGRLNLRFFLANGSAELFVALLNNSNWQNSLADNLSTIGGGQR